MKILILVLAVASIAQGTLLKTLARSSRGFSGSGSSSFGGSSAPYAPAIERGVEVGESEAFGSRAALGNRQYLPPAQPSHNLPQALPPAPAYIPPREGPQATHQAPQFAAPQNNYLPPQPHQSQPAPNYLPPQQPQPNYIPPQQPQPNYLPPQPHAAPSENFPRPGPSYLPPQPHSAPSQGHGSFAPPQIPQNSYIPPQQPSQFYGAPAQPQPAFNAPAQNYLPPSNPPAQNYLPPQGFPEQTAPGPNYAAPAPSYLPPAQNYIPPAASNLAGSFDSQSGYSYQAPFGGDNFGNAGGFDQVNNEYQEHISQEQPAPENFPISSAESEGFSEAISDGGGSAEHIEEPAPAPAPVAPVAPAAGPAENIKTIRVITENGGHSDTVKTVKVITEPNHSNVDESVKTIRVITEHRPSQEAPIEENVKVIRVIHENNAATTGYGDNSNVLRVISDGSSISSGVSSANILKIINDASVSSPAVETSKVVRIVSDGGSSALSSGSATSVLNLLSGGVTSSFGGVSEISGIADAPSKILRIVSDSGISSSAGDYYGSSHSGQDHVKLLKVVSGGASAISTPSNIVRVLASGVSPSYYSSSSNDIYSGYGHGSGLQALRILKKRDSSSTAVKKTAKSS